jgi:uncharacterized protein
MARRRTSWLRCPICRKRVPAKNAEFPFCSERCRLIDLGKWASNEYVISSPLRDTSDTATQPTYLPERDDKD